MGIDYIVLAAEVTNDPLGLGYAGMSNAQVATSLNALTRTKPRPALTGAAIFNALVPAEYEALTATEQDRVRWITDVGEVDISTGTNARAILLAAFGAGTTTRSNIAALTQEAISRATELELPVLNHGHIAQVR